MKTFKDVPIPIWMEKLPRDRRGYPIPKSVMIDDDGRPHFTVNNEAARQGLIRKECCAICGGKLLKRKALVGGPGPAFHPHGAYIDSAMHVDCARYALQVCPFLAAPNYGKLIDDKTVKHANFKYGVLTRVDEEAAIDRPELFVMVIFTKLKKIGHDVNPRIVQYLKPEKPYVAVEYWQHGRQLTEAEALAKSRGNDVLHP